MSISTFLCRSRPPPRGSRRTAENKTSLSLTFRRRRQKSSNLQTIRSTSHTGLAQAYLAVANTQKDDLDVQTMCKLNVYFLDYFTLFSKQKQFTKKISKLISKKYPKRIFQSTHLLVKVHSKRLSFKFCPKYDANSVLNAFFAISVFQFL